MKRRTANPTTSPALGRTFAAEKDAALIAAAPDMYRLLSMLLVRMDAEARDLEARGERPVFLFGAFREDVRAALAKAEGR